MVPFAKGAILGTIFFEPQLHLSISLGFQMSELHARLESEVSVASVPRQKAPKTRPGKLCATGRVQRLSVETNIVVCTVSQCVDIYIYIYIIHGCGSKLNRRGYAGFGPCFHLTRVPLWYRFFEPQPYIHIYNKSMC